MISNHLRIFPDASIRNMTPGKLWYIALMWSILCTQDATGLSNHTGYSDRLDTSFEFNEGDSSSQKIMNGTESSVVGPENHEISPSGISSGEENRKVKRHVFLGQLPLPHPGYHPPPYPHHVPQGYYPQPHQPYIEMHLPQLLRPQYENQMITIIDGEEEEEEEEAEDEEGEAEEGDADQENSEDVDGDVDYEDGIGDELASDAPEAPVDIKHRLKKIQVKPAQGRTGMLEKGFLIDFPEAMPVKSVTILENQRPDFSGRSLHTAIVEVEHDRLKKKKKENILAAEEKASEVSFSAPRKLESEESGGTKVLGGVGSSGTPKKSRRNLLRQALLKLRGRKEGGAVGGTGKNLEADFASPRADDGIHAGGSSNLFDVLMKAERGIGMRSRNEVLRDAEEVEQDPPRRRKFRKGTSKKHAIIKNISRRRRSRKISTSDAAMVRKSGRRTVSRADEDDADGDQHDDGNDDGDDDVADAEDHVTSSIAIPFLPGSSGLHSPPRYFMPPDTSAYSQVQPMAPNGLPPYHGVAQTEPFELRSQMNPHELGILQGLNPRHLSGILLSTGHVAYPIQQPYKNIYTRSLKTLEKEEFISQYDKRRSGLETLGKQRPSSNDELCRHFNVGCGCRGRVSTSSPGLRDKSRVCDGKCDCPTCDDETGCVISSDLSESKIEVGEECLGKQCTSCPPLQWSCSLSGKGGIYDKNCYKIEQRCDGKSDCPKSNSDEDVCFKLDHYPGHATSSSEPTKMRGYLYRMINGRWNIVCDSPWTKVEDQATNVCESTSAWTTQEVKPVLIPRALPRNPGSAYQEGSDAANATNNVFATLVDGSWKLIKTCNTVYEVSCPKKPCGYSSSNSEGSGLEVTWRDSKGKPPQQKAGFDPERSPGWLVSIFKDGHHVCEGTILNADWILTAAQCFVDRDAKLVPDGAEIQGSYFEVRAGTTRLNSASPFLQIREVSSIVIHEKYSGLRDKEDQRLLNDLAMLKVDQSLDFNAHVHCAKVQIPGHETEELRKCYTAGWGLHAPNQLTGSDTVNVWEMKIANPCPIVQDRLQKLVHTCAVPRNASAAKRVSTRGALARSGGPLMCKSGQQMLVTGVATYPNGYIELGQTGTYTTLEPYLKWINQVLDKAYSIAYNPFMEQSARKCPSLKCSDGRCIAQNQKCDGLFQCPSMGEDEINGCSSP